MANLIVEALGKEITFSDITEVVEKRSDKIIVKVNGEKYAISMTRLNNSKKEDNTVLYVSRDGAWLIPADSVAEQQKPDWK